MGIIGKPPVVPALKEAIALGDIKARGRWVLAATILGSSMAYIDGTAINVALPAFQDKLDATITQVQWVIEIYSLFLAALILVGGALGDRFGRKLIYGTGIALFATASIMCGLSQSVHQLIAFRALQGVGGALLIPGSLAIISAYFGPAERGKAIGTWGAFSAITTAVGPVLGGWLIEHVSWRWIFFINVPIAVAVLAILAARVPESKGDAHDREVDFTGAALATLGLGGIVFGLIESANLGFGSPVVIGSLVLGALLLAAFVRIEKNSHNPMIPLALFSSRTFTGANVVTLFLYGALGAVFFFLPFALIQVYGYSATMAGASVLPIILILFALSRWTGELTDKYGAKLLLVAGTVTGGLGYVTLALFQGTGSYFTTFFPGIALLGLGLALSVAPLTTAVMNAVDVGWSGTASGINNAVSRMAGLMAIAAFGIVMLHAFNFSLDRELNLAGITPEVRHMLDSERIKMAGAEIPAALDPETRAVLAAMVKSSYVNGFDIVIYMAAALSFLSALVAWFTIRRE